MNKKYYDQRINSLHENQFNKRGWTLVDLGLSNEIIKDTLIGLKEMSKLALKNEYKPRRIYHDHLFSNNLAAIELPFNKNICNNKIKSFFKEAKIGSLVSSLMGWQNPCCDLARLFCMGNYRYRGNWHRDYDSDLATTNFDSNLRDILLVGIYLLPQKGFRILKKDYEFNGKYSLVPDYKIDKAIRSFPFPLTPRKDSFDVIDGKIGTALLFDPFLLHQGSNYEKRLDFHMKFCNSAEKEIKKNEYQDFSVIDILHENYKLPSSRDACLNDDKLAKIPFTERSSYFARFLNTIDYRFLVRRLLKIKELKDSQEYKILKSCGWEIDLFANTFIQKQD